MYYDVRCLTGGRATVGCQLLRGVVVLLKFLNLLKRLAGLCIVFFFFTEKFDAQVDFSPIHLTHTIMILEKT